MPRQSAPRATASRASSSRSSPWSSITTSTPMLLGQLDQSERSTLPPPDHGLQISTARWGGDTTAGRWRSRSWRLWTSGTTEGRGANDEQEDDQEPQDRLATGRRDVDHRCAHDHDADDRHHGAHRTARHSLGDDPPATTDGEGEAGQSHGELTQVADDEHDDRHDEDDPARERRRAPAPAPASRPRRRFLRLRSCEPPTGRPLATRCNCCRSGPRRCPPRRLTRPSVSRPECQVGCW